MSAVTVLADRGGALAGPEAFTAAVLETITSATWPDGSRLVDVDPDVLRARVAPQIQAAAHALAAISAVTPRGVR